MKKRNTNPIQINDEPSNPVFHVSVVTVLALISSRVMD
jgi:hypothetical protein